MNAVESSRNRISEGLAALWRRLAGRRGMNRGAAWGLMIVGALLAFEIFNFSTTEFALRDVLGSLAFVGLPWATVLAIAFCSIDFAGIARIFTPQQGGDEPAEVWYLFGAWLLAAAFNATLTWWGVSIAIVSRANSSSAQVLGGDTLARVVPVFVAVMVWLIRVLIIGTLSVSGNKLFSTADSPRPPAPPKPSNALPSGPRRPWYSKPPRRFAPQRGPRPAWAVIRCSQPTRVWLSIPIRMPWRRGTAKAASSRATTSMLGDRDGPFQSPSSRFSASRVTLPLRMCWQSAGRSAAGLVRLSIPEWR